MPEAPEIDTDSVKDAMAEAPAGPALRNIALTTALLAALGAVAALRAGDTVNEALVLKTEAGRAQAEASDQWAYYQAKGIKGAVQEGARQAWIAAGKTPPVTIDQAIQKYAADQRTIEKAARDKERERDDESKQADVAALTQNRLIWFGSLLLGVVGAGLFGLTFLR
jgi:hypothetical protein